jgi:SAM-dependent methyltransferase
MQTLRRSAAWQRLKKTRVGRTALHLRELASDADRRATHQSEVNALSEERAQLERQRDQAELIINAVIERNYHGAKLPPPALRLHVGVNDHALNFWAKGIVSSQWVLDTFGTDPAGPVLDWGCGSGRTPVWLQCHDAWRAQYHGCDVDREAIDWLRSETDMRVEVCDDLPPLPYADGYFVGVFAFSVLTHIHPERHRDWYRELRRVLAPGGRLLVTLHGAWEVYEHHGAEFARAPFVQEAFERQGWAWLEAAPGEHYKDSSIVSQAFTRQAIEDLFDVEVFADERYGGQDVLLARRRSRA